MPETQEVQQKVERLAKAIMALPISTKPFTTKRQLIAIAGPPASGKSTLAKALVAELNKEGEQAALVPMDGYHLDNETLDKMGLRHRKGAPQTFDLAGFTALVKQMKVQADLSFALFDRNQDKTLPNAASLSAQHKLVVVEGNYLLLDQSGWRDLVAAWDFSVFLNEDLNILQQRLKQRWLDHGFNDQDAIRRAEQNDIPNAEQVLGQRLVSTMVV